MGIRLKLFLPAATAATFLASLIHFVWLPEIMERERQMVIDREIEEMTAFSPNLSQALSASTLAPIRQLLDKKLQDRSATWKSITLRKADGSLIYSSGGKTSPFAPRLEQLNHIIKLDGKSLANIRVAIDPQAVLAPLHRRLISLELWSLMILAMIFAATAMLQDRWVRWPIHRLQHAANRLARGDFTAKLKAESNDELGSLTAAFIDMRDELKTANATLEDALLTAQSQSRQSKAILGNVGDALVIFDRSGEITTFNHAAERTFGFDAADVLGRDILILMPDKTHAGFQRHIQASSIRTAHGDVEDSDLWGLRKDGTFFPMELNIEKVKVGDGESYIGVFRDISERISAREQLQKEKDKLGRILENTDDGYVTIDSHWKITYANPASAELLGIVREDVVGKDLRETVPDMVSMFYKILRKTMALKTPQQTAVLYGPTMKYLQAHTRCVFRPK